MTLHDTLCLMAGEPWCFDPGQIARLTDYQIHHLYVLPAARKVERERARAEGRGAQQSIEEIVASGGKPSKESVVALYLSHGVDPQSARRMVDEQFAEWESAPADAWWRKVPEGS